MNETKSSRSSPLLAQLRWFIMLRWIAAAAVVLGALVEHRIGWFGGIAARVLAIGVILFLYNVALSSILPRVQQRRGLLWMALAQLLLDMIALTALVAWTGGIRSPLIAFFVFHMVFASLLLPEMIAFASAAAACLMIGCGLALSHKWPVDRTDRLAGIGILITLVLTVMLTNRITQDLRAHRRRLVRKSRRIKAMSEQLQRQQQALVQHEKMVAMGRMAAGVTHEITNPLASMDSLLQLIQRRPERMKPETIQTLRDQVSRINQIIQQMKTFAHPAEMQSAKVEINEVVEQALNMLRFDSRIKSVEVRREFDPAAGSIALLPQALQQVMVNLISNALDAMSATASPALTIRTYRREEWCVVEVSDNGHGIDAKHMPRLFEPFFTTKPVGKGTGLGLSISYSLMQKQGGSISVRSQSQRGTTFTLRLPTSAADSSHSGSDSGASRNRESVAVPFVPGEKRTT
jgi:signal transduction histidine kinase